MSELGILGISQISSYIRKRLAEAGVSQGSIEYVASCLDDKYKDPRFRREDKYKDVGGNGTLAADNVKYKPSADLTAAELQQEVEELKPSLDQLNEEKRRKTERFNELLERASREKIALTIPTKPESKSTPKPDGRVTKMADAFRFGVELFTKLTEKAEEFPSDAAEEEYHAQSVYQYLSIFTPMVDEKWSADWVSPNGWIQIEKQNEIKGKHGGATSKEAKILTISGEIREMTREQVGDKFEEVADKTCELYNALPGITGIGDWYNKRVRPFIGQRKVDLHDTLSEKA